MWQVNSVMQPAVMVPMMQHPMITPMVMQAQPQQQQHTVCLSTHPLIQHQQQQQWAINTNGTILPYQNDNGIQSSNVIGMDVNTAGPFF